MRRYCTLFVVPITLAMLLAVFGARVYAQHDGDPPRSIVFSGARDGHANTQIYVMHPDGSDVDRITHDTASDADPDISPNGHQVVFTSDQTQTGNNNIFIRDRLGSVRNLTNNPATDEWARWSPDGKHIVFDSNRDGGIFEIYVMKADGRGTAKRLTDPPVLSRYASWSPDGEQIVFRRGINIFTMNADEGGTPIQLTNEVAPSFAQMPVWSPDGRYIAFMSFREGYCSVFRMNADGSQQVNLTPKNPGDPSTHWCSRAPSWSADGRKIFFMSSRPGTVGQNQIFVMEMDGTDLRQLTDEGSNGSPRAQLDDDDRDHEDRDLAH